MNAETPRPCTPSNAVFGNPGQRGTSAEYSELYALVSNAGLLAKQTRFYFQKIGLNLVLLLAGLLPLLTTPHFSVRLLLACYLAVVSAQMAFLVHDAGHGQIGTTRRRNRIIGIVHANLLLGFSYQWWVDKHNRHHSTPNEECADPDVDVPLLALSHAQATSKRGLARLVVQHQAYLLVPLLLLQAIAFRVATLQFLCRRGQRHPAEILLLGLHYALVSVIGLYVFGLFQFLVLSAVYNAALGFLLGVAFVTNHIGMPLLPAGAKIDFLRRQVLTARNVRAHWLVAYFLGGLTYQIEHHLFPALPLNRLEDARAIVRAYCISMKLEYRETGLWQSYREVFCFLRTVASNASTTAK